MLEVRAGCGPVLLAAQRRVGPAPPYRKTPSHVAVVPPGALARFSDRSSP